MGIDLGRFRSKNNDDWVEWLSEDPVPPSVRSKMRADAVRQASQPRGRSQVQAAPVPQQPPQSNNGSDKPATVSIHISVPKIRKPSRDQIRGVLSNTYDRVPDRLKSRKYAVGASSLVLIGLVGAIVASTGLLSGDKPADDSKNVLSKSTQQADFEYSLPGGSKEEADSDVRFDPEKKVVNFQDSIGGVQIVISQQKLPVGFEEGTDEKVKKLAEEFAANEQLTTANPTAYLGTSEKGPQTVIFAKKGLLVFIQSSKKIDSHDWAEYITNLK